MQASLKQRTPSRAAHQDKVYFPNLNGLRLIAAMIVLISHVELVDLDNNTAVLDSHAIGILGRVGVNLFFVLSGFLITYLLLNEQTIIGKISIKNFYVRRILKIWPLYYLIIGIAFFILPRILPPNTTGTGVTTYLIPNLVLYVFFVPNLAFFLMPNVWGAVQSWSIGVEEQFYLIWPLLVNKAKQKPLLFAWFIGGYEFFKFIGFRLFKKYIYWNDTLGTLREFWDKGFTIECLAIGGIFAYILFEEKTGYLKIAFSTYTQLITLVVVLVIVFNGVYIYNLNDEVFSLLFGIIIINAAANPGTIFRLEHPLFNYLGKISYGIYMYHMSLLLLYVHFTGNNRSRLLDYIVAVFGTILLSSLSYEFFEKKILQLKKRFTVIESGSI